jgi:hypothetical protein
MSITRARCAPPVALTRSSPAPALAPEVIVVTHDAELGQALRSAAPSTTIRIATTPAALADLLVAGRAGALVLDLAALDSAALTVTRHLAEQFPEVPLVTVGSREDEARLAGLISGGLIYRFLHRPVSAARARTFIEAALRRSADVGSVLRASAAPAGAQAVPRTRPLLAAAAAGAAVALGLGFWLALRLPSGAPTDVPRPLHVTRSARLTEATQDPGIAPVPAPAAIAAPAATLTRTAAVAAAASAEPLPPTEQPPRVEPVAAVPPAPVTVTAAPDEVTLRGGDAAAEAAPPDVAVAAPPAPEPEPPAAGSAPPDGG